MFDASEYKGRVDCIHAGIPCQKWSTARHGVGDGYDGWPETRRIVRDVCPKYVFIESTPRIKNHPCMFRELEDMGYSVVSTDAIVGSLHIRRRFWAIAYSNHQGELLRGINAKTSWVQTLAKGFWESDPRIFRMDDGLAHKMDRLKAIGNGQVPLQAAAAWVMLGGPHNIFP